jgi:hypothetical protein
MIENNNNNPTVAPAAEKIAAPAVQPVQAVTADVPKVEIAEKK